MSCEHLKNNMRMGWEDLSKKAQRRYIAACGTRHAEWNGLPSKEVQRRLKVQIKKYDELFDVPMVPYEDTRL